MKIAFHGQRGSYAEAAAAWMYSSEDIATVPCQSTQAVVDAVIDGSCQQGVIRAESTEWGTNFEILNLLRATRVYFARDIRFHERYNLAGQQGTHPENIKRIYAHPAILFLCGNYMSRLSGVEIFARYDSAEYLADLVRRGDKKEAVVCSDFAASIFGLRVLQPGIENSSDGTTRFISLSAQKVAPAPEAANVTTAMLFELKHRPGALMEALAAFKDHQINITSVVARPSRASRWDYATYVEIAGRFDDEPVRAALAELREHTTYLQLLGSFDTIEPHVPGTQP
ncbi:MAG: ACT domain-containing protein [Planctomycetes bacterium]|nr:ACT domain-containing protein [Planctomycetota bacterium]MCW8134822.1 ACT domain-containing protein [Planctomycetota bacterium]